MAEHYVTHLSERLSREVTGSIPGQDPLTATQSDDVSGGLRQRLRRIAIAESLIHTLGEARSWEKTKLQIREVSSLFEIWRGSFKTVEGNFGSSVLSYFVFVKWLFLLNIISMVIILATIVLPQALMQPSSFNQSISNIQGSAESGFVQDASRCSAAYDQQLYNLSERQGTTDKILDFFQGTGWMEKTYLFTGFYFNKTLIYGDSHQHYNMPVAFLLATAAYFTITLIAMVKYTAIGMRNQRMSGEKFYDYCNKVFSGWDFSLSKDKAAADKHKNLFHEYSNDLEEARQKLRREGMSIGRKSCILFFRAVIWIVTLAILAASGYLIYQIGISQSVHQTNTNLRSIQANAATNAQSRHHAKSSTDIRHCPTRHHNSTLRNVSCCGEYEGFLAAKFDP
ncbi:hypothetical protein CAPTEDRAFT_216997, partial [Capitella teleta]